jgi:hypothetical protein
MLGGSARFSGEMPAASPSGPARPRARGPFTGILRLGGASRELERLGSRPFP